MANYCRAVTKSLRGTVAYWLVLWIGIILMPTLIRVPLSTLMPTRGYEAHFPFWCRSRSAFGSNPKFYWCCKNRNFLLLLIGMPACFYISFSSVHNFRYFWYRYLLKFSGKNIVFLHKWLKGIRLRIWIGRPGCRSWSGKNYADPTGSRSTNWTTYRHALCDVDTGYPSTYGTVPVPNEVKCLAFFCVYSVGIIDRGIFGADGYPKILNLTQSVRYLCFEWSSS